LNIHQHPEDFPPDPDSSPNHIFATKKKAQERPGLSVLKPQQRKEGLRASLFNLENRNFHSLTSRSLTHSLLALVASLPRTLVTHTHRGGFEKNSATSPLTTNQPSTSSPPPKFPRCLILSSSSPL
jgi:hypothetical protein